MDVVPYFVMIIGSSQGELPGRISDKGWGRKTNEPNEHGQRIEIHLHWGVIHEDTQTVLRGNYKQHSK